MLRERSVLSRKSCPTVLYGSRAGAYREPMILLVLLVAFVAVLAVGATYEWQTKRHLPHDSRQVGTEGLPSDASIRSGELGRDTAGGIAQSYDPGGGT